MPAPPSDPVRTCAYVVLSTGTEVVKRSVDVVLGGVLLLVLLNFLHLISDIPVARIVEVLLAGVSIQTFAYYAFTVLFVWTTLTQTVFKPEGWFDQTDTREPTDRSVFGNLVVSNFKTVYTSVITVASTVVAVQLGTVSLLFGLVVGVSLPVLEAAVVSSGRTPPLYVLTSLLFLLLVPIIVLGALVVSVFRRTPNLLLSAWEMADEAMEEVARSNPSGRSVAGVLGSLLSRRPGAR